MRFFVLLFVFSFGFAQVGKTAGVSVITTKEFSKDIALFHAKAFLFQNVLKVSESPSKFEVDPLAATSSGELTTLIYKSPDRNMEGLVLGFFSDNWNENGVIYKAYAFKNLSATQASEFLDKIRRATDDNVDFLREDNDNHNVFFEYDGINVLIYRIGGSNTIRLFWNGFDSTWESLAFNRSKRRFERKIK